MHALQRDRNDCAALLGLAGSYLADGNLDAARVVAARAAMRHPGAVAAHTLLGSVLLEQDNLDDGRAAFLAALHLNKHSRKAWAGVGVVCERSADLAAADIAWRNAFGGAEPALCAYRGAGVPMPTRGWRSMPFAHSSRSELVGEE